MENGALRSAIHLSILRSWHPGFIPLSLCPSHLPPLYFFHVVVAAAVAWWWWSSSTGVGARCGVDGGRAGGGQGECLVVVACGARCDDNVGGAHLREGDNRDRPVGQSADLLVFYSFQKCLPRVKYYTRQMFVVSPRNGSRQRAFFQQNFVVSALPAVTHGKAFEVSELDFAMRNWLS